jgi:hypothetical protein
MDPDSPKQLFIEEDSDPALDAGKVITEKLWSELGEHFLANGTSKSS